MRKTQIAATLLAAGIFAFVLGGCFTSANDTEEVSNDTTDKVEDTVSPDVNKSKSMTFLASDLDDGDIIAEKTVGDFTLIATDSMDKDKYNGHFTVDGNNATVDEIKYTKRLKTNGAGSKTKRAVKFTPTGSATIIVVAASASGSESREFVIESESGDTIDSKSVDKVEACTFEYTGSGETLYLYAKAGVNFYAIYVNKE